MQRPVVWTLVSAVVPAGSASGPVAQVVVVHLVAPVPDFPRTFDHGAGLGKHLTPAPGRNRRPCESCAQQWPGQSRRPAQFLIVPTEVSTDTAGAGRHVSRQ